jgi:quinoprotein glucose dehydrogenase
VSVVAAITLPRTALAVGMHTRTAEESAEAAMRKAIAHPATTRNALLSPDYPVAFDAAEKSIESYKVASGLKMAAWAAEPQLANPVAISIDEKGRLWACETFRFDGGGPGMGVYDIRHMYDRLDEDLASKTVEQRMATLNKWNHNDNSSLTQWPDRLRLIEDRDGDGRADYSSIFAQWSEPLDGLASGVITRGDDVYVTNIPHLWLLRDEIHDGKAVFV